MSTRGRALFDQLETANAVNTGLAPLSWEALPDRQRANWLAYEVNRDTTVMSAAEFGRLAVCRYSDARGLWASVARYLNTEESTVHRYRNGTRSVPAWVARRMRAA